MKSTAMSESAKKRVKANASLTKKNMEKAGFVDLPKKKEDSEAIKKIKALIIARRPSKIDFRAITRDDNIRRRIIKDDDFMMLRESIKEHGILQNIVVEFTQLDHEKFRLKCVSGHRRLEALHDLEKNKEVFTHLDETTNEITFNPFEVPVQFISGELSSGENKSKQIALSENVHRKDLHFVEIADTYLKIMELEGLSIDELAARFDISKKSVNRYLKLAKHFPEDSKIKIIEHPEAFPFQYLKDKIIDTANYKSTKFISSLISRRLTSFLKGRSSSNDSDAAKRRVRNQQTKIHDVIKSYSKENKLDEGFLGHAIEILKLLKKYPV